MGKHYAHHLTEDSGRRISRGFGFDSSGTGVQDARGMLEWILREGKIPGGNQKGYFHKTQIMPRSVSFSDLSLERLGRLVRDRSYYGLAIGKSRFSENKLKAVVYLNDEKIMEFSNSPDNWLVDLIRPNDMHFEYGDECGDNSRGFVAKAYDYSWQREMRIKCSELKITSGPDFVFVPDKDEIKRFNETFGVEAYNLKLHFVRLKAIYEKHGRILPVEELLFNVLSEMKKEGKKTDRESGRFVLDEAVDKVWQNAERFIKN